MKIQTKKYIKAFLCLSLIIVAIFSLSSCAGSGTGEVLFLDEYVQCNVTESGENFAFEIMYLYQGKKPDVEFLNFDNANATAMLTATEDTTIETIQDKEYRGYKAASIGFYFDMSPLPQGDKLQINTVTLLVNNEKTTLDMTGQIVVNKVSDTDGLYDCISLYPTNVPVVLFSQGQDIELASFNYHTEHAATIEKFEFSDYLQITNSQVYVDNASVGSIEEAFPLSVGADQAVRIDIDANFGSYDSFSDFYLNSLLYYQSEEDGNKIAKDYLAVASVANFDNLSSLIDHVLEG